MIEKTYFLIIWLILAFIDNILSVYVIRLSKKNKNQDITKNKKNLQILFVKKLGLIPGCIMAYVFMSVIIFMIAFLMYQYLDSLVILIIFMAIVILDIVIIFADHLPKIIRLKKSKP